MTAGPDPVWPGTALQAGGAVTHLGGVALADLAAAHGTPLYVVDRAEMVGRMRRWRAAMGEGNDVWYASKALCLTEVLRTAHAEGLGVDVASDGELATALAAGVPGERILLHGNTKSIAELTSALDAGVGRIVVDSLGEIEQLASLRRPARVLLRLTPGFLASTHSSIATAADDQKFGLSIGQGLAEEAVRRLRELPDVHLVGLHVHIGSNIASPDDFAAGIARLGAFAADSGLDLEELNLGGGLGIVYREGDEVPTIEQHVATLRSAVEASLPTVPRLAVEPGRSIVGPSGITLYEVGSVKQVGDVVSFVGVDGGMSDNPRPALYGARYTVAPVAPGSAEDRQVVLAGAHCESGDVLVRDVALPGDLVPGDLVAVAATGAYNQSMASNYNRFRRPAVVLVADGRARLLQRRETIADVLARDVVGADWQDVVGRDVNL